MQNASMKRVLLSIFLCFSYVSAGNEVNITRSVEVINSIPTLSSVTLEGNASTVNVGETVQLSVMGTYSDGSTNAVDENITYTIIPTENAEVNGSVLTAKKDGNVTVQATVGGVKSNTIALTITWEVDGHVLPPEPDPAVNDATLLGVDSNNNGVRDDVERWIYETYNEFIPCHQELDWNNTMVIDGETIPSAVQVCEENPVPYHPVVRAVAMQKASAAQIIIQEPEKAREMMKFYDNALYCEFYIYDLSKENNDSSLGIEGLLVKKFNKAQYNTVQRARAYGKYNFHLSGGVYRLPKSKDMINGCDENIKNIIKGLK